MGWLIHALVSKSCRLHLHSGSGCSNQATSCINSEENKHHKCIRALTLGALCFHFLCTVNFTMRLANKNGVTANFVSLAVFLSDSVCGTVFLFLKSYRHSPLWGSCDGFWFVKACHLMLWSIQSVYSLPVISYDCDQLEKSHTYSRNWLLQKLKATSDKTSLY